MQYGAEIFPYERINKKEESLKKHISHKKVLELVAYFAASILICRVNLINGMVPFGIAFIMAVAASKKSFKIVFACHIGALIGYVSNYELLNKVLAMYIIIIGILLLLCYLCKSFSSNKLTAVSFIFSFVIMGSFYKLIMNYNTTMCLINSLCQIGCIFPIYYIQRYALLSLKYVRTKHLFSSEEIIAMGATFGLAIAGTKGLSIYGISIANILCLFIVIFLAYIKGAGTGAAIGVALGTILGISSFNMMAYIGVYGICGLVAGVFKEGGKYFTSAAFLISFMIVKFYSSLGNNFKIVEALIIAITFMLIKNSFLNKFCMEFDSEVKGEFMLQNSINKMKELFVERLNGYNDILSSLVSTLKNLGENDKLLIKNKSTAMVQCIADRNCTNCSMKSSCWSKEYLYTYNAMGELILNFEKGVKKLPKEIDRKCIKRKDILNSADEIVNSYIVSEIKNNSIREGRQMLSLQLENIVGSISEMGESIKSNINLDCEIESLIKKAFHKNEINYNDVYILKDKNNRIKINLSLKACGGKQKCVKEILPVVNNVLKVPMCVSEEGCNIKNEGKNCEITLEEAPLYHVTSYMVKKNKDGENCSGDTSSFRKLKNGSYMVLLSDGMGSGPMAKNESAISVDLIEKIVSEGFDNSSAINIVNSFMSIKNPEDEKFSTLDLCNINLYTGETEFLKVGAVPSFIKSKDDIYVINSSTLPLGVFDNVEIEKTTRNLKNGDMILMLSDGVLDYDSKALLKYDWVEEFLNSSNKNSPRDLAEDILKKAEELSKGKINDDMTVIVSKIFKIY